MLPLNFSLELAPLFTFTPVYDWADGIFSPLQRACLQAWADSPKTQDSEPVTLTFFYAPHATDNRPDSDNIRNNNNNTVNEAILNEEKMRQEIYAYLNYIYASMVEDFGFAKLKSQENFVAEEKFIVCFEKRSTNKNDDNKKPIRAANYFKNFAHNLENDIENFLFLQANAFADKQTDKQFFHPSVEARTYTPQEPHCQNVTNKNIWIHREAKVARNCEFDTSGGSIVIDKGACVSAFSLLRGPLYIGKHAVVDKALLSNARIGNFCRVGGEISDTLMAAFSNKHHEGFVGHSLIGSWVNLGALTTTSDLKNNYGTIHLQYREWVLSSSEIKFGSIIGDFVKTAIGTMFNSGTIIDTGALLFNGFPQQKYYPPFFWGGEQVTRYQWQRFLQDTQKIMQRRKQSLSEYQKEKLSQLYSQ